MSEQRWRLVQDDDSHWYLIPADKYDAFREWEDAIYHDQDPPGEDFSGYATGGGYDYTFTDPVRL